MGQRGRGAERSQGLQHSRCSSKL